MITSSNASLKGKLARYTAASTALAAGTTAADAFEVPYEIPASTSVSGVSMEGTFGDWTGSFSGAGSTAQNFSSLFSSGSPVVNELYFEFAHNFGEPAATSYSFTTVAAASGDVDFTIVPAFINGEIATASFIRNGADEGSIAIGDDYNFAITAGDTFGFRFTTGYGFDASAGNVSLYISNFSAAVPEVANFATWMGAGALGLIGMRTARRRRSHKAVDTV